jgi:hypothetical protein
MTGSRVGAKTVIAYSDLQTVFDPFWEPQSSPIESGAGGGAQDHWPPAGLRHG